MKTNKITIRLYEHPEAGCTCYDGEGNLYEDGPELNGWDYEAGQTVDGWELTSVGGNIQTGDTRGNYVEATATRA